MVAQNKIIGLPKASDSRHVILRIRSADRDRLERHLFKRYPEREWGTFFRFGFRRTNWGLVLSFVDGIWPAAGDLDPQSGATAFQHQYALRAFRDGAAGELGIGVVHSHPAGCGTSPSSLDDDMDGYFAKELASYTGGRPYCSLIFQRSNGHGFTFSGRLFDRGEWFPVRETITIGTSVERITSELYPRKCFSGESVPSDWVERQVQLYGAGGARRLQQSRIGILGCSGTGTPAAHVLARAGVGEFVLVDPERLSASNMERIHAAFAPDLLTEPRPFKVELLRRLINAINPHAQVKAFVGNALHENALDALLGCDLLLGCTDSVHGRVLLSDLAKHFLMPSIDVGVYMNGDGGRVGSQVVGFTRYGPDDPCAFCNGLIDTAALAEELMSDEEKSRRRAQAQSAAARGAEADQYWHGQRQLHTVGYLTTLAGAQAAGYAEGLLSGAFEMPHTCFQFDISKLRMGVVPSDSRNGNCTCHLHRGWADQARSYRNVSRPSHWPPRAILLSSGGSAAVGS